MRLLYVAGQGRKAAAGEGATSAIVEPLLLLVFVGR